MALKMHVIKMAVFCGLALYPFTGHSDIYKFTDDEGRVHYSNVPPSDEAEPYIKGRKNSTAAQEKATASDGEETKVVINHNAVIVPVLLGHEGRKKEVMMLFDTGATNIILHHDVARDLKIETLFRSTAQVVSGDTIQADIARVDYVKVGPHKKKDLHVGIIRYEGPPVLHQGLLGMNFIKGLEYHIDFDKKVIAWKKE